MYSTNLDAIYWDVIDFGNIISNIKNIDFEPGLLTMSFRKFNATDTKTSKGPSNNEHSKHLSRKKARKKRSKAQNESTLSEWKLRDTKELINLSGHKVQNQPENAFLRWKIRGFCFSDSYIKRIM